jgi:CYTH domain-containing protein
MEELERTFLIKYLPPIKNFPFEQYFDIYIPNGKPHPTLRIRKRGKTYEITKKELIDKSDRSRHLETTISLTPDEYNFLSTLKGKKIVKKRYYYKESGIDYEIDVFEEKLKGLILVDIEFKNKKSLTKFIPPPWILTEVTDEEILTGGMLCGKSYSNIIKILKKYNYVKVI